MIAAPTTATGTAIAMVLVLLEELLALLVLLTAVVEVLEEVEDKWVVVAVVVVGCELDSLVVIGVHCWVVVLVVSPG